MIRAREWVSRPIIAVEPPRWQGASEGAYSLCETEAQRSQRGWIGREDGRLTHSRALSLVGALVGLGLAPGLAAAQSTRYPPPEPDLDEELDTYSDFWENAIEPGKDVYDDLVARAAKLIGRRSDEARRSAIELLDQAAALLPDRAPAWAWLGLAHEYDDQFPECRDALERAWALEPDWAGSSRSLGLALGNCRARAGDLDGAAEILERLVARGDVRVETLWRLGEVDVALGHLDDARTVLGVALDQSPADLLYANAAWTLAVAADRARDPEATLAAAEIALRMDPERVRAGDPPGGFLPASEAAYYVGFAADVAGIPERALLHFRRYVADEIDGPWVKRAKEHVRALRDFAIDKRVEQVGTEKIDLAKAAEAIGKVEPALRACMKETPMLLAQLRVTQVGVAPVVVPPEEPKPKKGKGRGKGKGKGEAMKMERVKPAPPRRNQNIPPAGAHAIGIESYEGDPIAVATALACLDKVASGLSLPAPQTVGTWVTVTAPVISR